MYASNSVWSCGWHFHHMVIIHLLHTTLPIWTVLVKTFFPSLLLPIGVFGFSGGVTSKSDVDEYLFTFLNYTFEGFHFIETNNVYMDSLLRSNVCIYRTWCIRQSPAQLMWCGKIFVQTRIIFFPHEWLPYLNFHSSWSIHATVRQQIFLHWNKMSWWILSFVGCTVKNRSILLMWLKDTRLGIPPDQPGLRSEALQLWITSSYSPH